MKLQSVSVAQARLLTDERQLDLLLGKGHVNINLGDGVTLTTTKGGLILTGENSKVEKLWNSINAIHWVEARSQDGEDFLVIYTPNGDYLDTVEQVTDIPSVVGDKPYHIHYK